MRDRDHWRRVFWLVLSISLILLSGFGQEAGMITSPGRGDLSPNENFSLDSDLLVPSASALPGEAKVNTVAPELGPGVNYTSIQEAIDNSDPGDVIRVQSGTYNEVVTVNKPGLSLKGVDSGDGMPIVRGDGVESTVTLSSDGCSLEGFVVINSGNPHAGIDVKSSNNTIVGNTIKENRGYGIHVGGSTRNNTIFGNDALSNGFHGISLENTSKNNITANSLSSNNMSGIYLENSRENRLSDNLVADNKEHGIYLFVSHRNFITRNIANNNRLSEIELVNSEDNVLEGNLVIEVEKTADRAEGRRSEYINFTIQVINIGQVDLDSVTVIDWLPPGLEYVRDNRSGQIQDDKIAWKFGALAGNESEFIELTARFDGTEFGVLTNLVNVTGTSPQGVVVHHVGSEEVISIMRIVPGESISAAIDLMDPGSIIEVESGTYNENLILDKPLVLRGMNTGGGMPTLMGDGVESTVTLKADGCTLDNFVIKGSGNPHAGIEVRSNNNMIMGNAIRENNGYGVYLSKARDNTVIGNEINKNGFDGVYIEDSDQNDVDGNSVKENGWCGLRLSGSKGNVVSGNAVSGNSQQGIYLKSRSADNTISGNAAGNNDIGIILADSSGNTISENTAAGNRRRGIQLVNSNDNSVSGNTASNNGYSGGGYSGLFLERSNYNTITGNTASNNKANGIYVYLGCEENFISGNKFSDNGGNGIALYSGSNIVENNIATRNFGGIKLYQSSDNVISGNTASENSERGIFLHLRSCRNAITGNTVSNNNGNGIFVIDECNDNTISGNTFNDNKADGIRLQISSGNTVQDNVAKGNNRGIHHYQADGNTISNNDFSNNSESSVWLQYSSNNIVSSNIANNNHIGIGVWGSGNTISDNIVTGNPKRGIELLDSNENTISGNTVSNNGYSGGGYSGIFLERSNYNTITGNTASNNKANGIYVYLGCEDNFISSNTFSDNGGNGIALYSGSNIVENNIATRNFGGIKLYQSSENVISGNTASENSERGIFLHLRSCRNAITGNTVSNNNGNGIFVIDQCNDNTIAGNAFNDNADGIRLQISSGNTVQDNIARGNNRGIHHYQANGNTISDNDFSNNDEIGIWLESYSNNNIISANIADNNHLGIIVGDSSGNNISNNNVTGNTWRGIQLGYSNDNTISYNIIRNNGYSPNGFGILIDYSKGNIVYLNKLINNRGNCYSYSSTNSWNSPEPISYVYEGSVFTNYLGNYWSDYTGSDVNSDGIGDTPRVIRAGIEQDNYPLIGADEFRSNLDVNKVANRSSAKQGDIINYAIWVNNTGAFNITSIICRDNLTGHQEDLGTLEPGEGHVFYTAYEVGAEDFPGPLTNNVTAEGIDVLGNNVTGYDSASVTLLIDPLAVNKTALEKEVERGGNVTYVIDIRNTKNPGLPATNVVVEDVFDKRVEIISAQPPPDEDGKWRFDEIGPGELVNITLVVKIPEASDFIFDVRSGIRGEGFVNVDNEYSTTLDPYFLNNHVRVTFFNQTSGVNETISDSETVTVLGEPGTELETREHGSGSYESDEQVLVRTENKSISMEKDVSATYAPTTLGLYNNRTVAYSSKWTEEARAKNRVTGTSMSESYRYATSIDRESRMMIDKNESVMELESEFDGMGHIGFLKKEAGASQRSAPLFESREDYVGSFRVLEKMDEYGSGIGSEKSASGEGLVLVDKRVGTSQRSYESGAGSYDSDELIRTETNYIAKDLSVSSGGVETNLSGSFSVNSSMNWKEGMWSRVANTSFIGEEYTSTTELDKETIARGLNDMETLANFTGKGRFRVVLRDEVDIDDEYDGTYSVERRVLIEGVPTYERPHLSLAKEGEINYPASDASPLASYTISIENDGDKSLGPVIVKDIFPPGAVFVNSSLRPSELAEGRAVWTLTHLAIGDKFEIGLWLNLTGYRGDEIVNQVEAEGGYNESWARAENFSAHEIDWLRCCPSGDIVTVTKSDQIDANESNFVWYTVEVENVAEGAAAAVVTDYLPDGMVVVDASPEFASLEDGIVTWNLVDLMPGETRSINYRAEAEWSGRFVNRVRVDASLVDGSGTSTAYASSVVEVGEFEGEIPVPGWQPPEWDLNDTGYSADMTCEEICELTLS